MAIGGAFECRTKIDWAGRVQWVLDNQQPDAEKMVLVLDNLNRRVVSSLYEAFPPEEALRFAEGLAIHYTPKHGSWLGLAEMELSALAGFHALRHCTRNWLQGKHNGMPAKRALTGTLPLTTLA